MSGTEKLYAAARTLRLTNRLRRIPRYGMLATVLQVRYALSGTERGYDDARREGGRRKGERAARRVLFFFFFCAMSLLCHVRN